MECRSHDWQDKERAAEAGRIEVMTVLTAAGLRLEVRNFSSGKDPNIFLHDFVCLGPLL